MGRTSYSRNAPAFEPDVFGVWDETKWAFELEGNSGTCMDEAKGLFACKKLHRESLYCPTMSATFQARIWFVGRWKFLMIIWTPP